MLRSPLLMRIALDWDFASVSRTLVGFRMHAHSATAQLGSFTGSGYELDSLPRILFQKRMQFLDGAGLTELQTQSYRALATQTFRREEVKYLANRAGSGSPWMSTNRDLLQLVRDDARVLFVPAAWRLVASQLGARYLRSALRHPHRRRRSSQL